MRLRTKFIVSILIIGILWASAAVSFNFIKEKYLYPFISGWLHNYVKAKCGGDLYIGSVKGSVFTNLALSNVLIENFKGCPQELRFKAEAVKISYRPFGILQGRFDAEFKNPGIVFGSIYLPVSIYHHNDTTNLSFEQRVKGFDSFAEVFLESVCPAADLLTKFVTLTGYFDIDGHFVLKGFKPHFFNINVKSSDCRIGRASSLMMKGSAELDVSGRDVIRQVTGSVNINQIYLANGLSSLSLIKIQKSDFESDLLKNARINIKIDSKKASVKDSYLDASLDSAVELKKEEGGKPYLLGNIDILSGVYRDYINKFDITKGRISFIGENKSPLIEIEAEERVNNYTIYANIKGGVDDSVLILTSDSELTRSDIISLLVFGKEKRGLTNIEKRGLASSNISRILISSLFLGRAEAKQGRINQKPDNANRYELSTKFRWNF